MNRTLPFSLALAAGVAAVPVSAAETAPVPSSLMNRNAVVCVKVTPKGSVHDAFVVQSTGDAKADADMIEWIRSVPWPKAKPGDLARNKWQPVPVAMGTAAVPALPDRCAPPKV